MPVTIPPFSNVPAPGDDVKSAWAQQLTQYAVDTAAAVGALVTSNPATGRLVIGGHELGDTGFRNVAGLLGAGWTATGPLVLHRTGRTVFFGGDVSTGATPAATMITLPAGFWPISTGAFTVGFLLRNEPDESKAQWYRILTTDGRVFSVWEAMAPNQSYCRFGVTFTTDNGWPSTLPGVPL